ncbi:MAG: serine/threonine protein kinase, partial [Deltaproteobacteria bacterium]|nr:serine/threonine protein kinase [Deltaproteobacteria bacterium]
MPPRTRAKGLMENDKELVLLLGEEFAERYELLGDLGSGSFGRVIKARQRTTGQLVAIKILRLAPLRRGSEGSGRVERFRRELRLCSELSHPNIVRLIDSGTATDGSLYAVLEFVPGMTLRDVLDAEQKLSVRETMHLMTQVLDALSCAHTRGVVHRDLK